MCIQFINVPHPTPHHPNQPCSYFSLAPQVLGCACYADVGMAGDGVRVGEITAIIVHPAYRRAGFGDSLLDFVEQQLRQSGFRRIVLVVDSGSVEFFTQVGRRLGWACTAGWA